jgi:UDP-hydrolysing UDP-N-acetyl-D-glucosamine 2-epimerase
MKKILAISGIRSDYDLMSVLYRRLVADPEIDFRLIAGGAHLSKTYGQSIELIRADGIPLLAAIESLIDADSTSARLKSASIMLQNSIDVVAAWKPDLILYAGDREEVWIGALLGIYLDIPTIHFYGGDHTNSWHPDNVVRHAVSKLSTLHVVTTEEHRDRLRAMGEPDWRIRVLGSLALDNFLAQVRADSVQIGGWDEVSQGMGNWALVLFHPDPSEGDIAGSICRNILLEVKAAGLGACVGYPNSDPANRDIIAAFAEFENEPRFFFYRNLERAQFISLYKRSQFIIGNSSSGIMEAASIPIPAINVGVRQRGRCAGKNVIFVDSDRQSLRKAIGAVMDPVFRKSIAGMSNPYGDGRSCDGAYSLIVNTNFSKLSHKTEDPLDKAGQGWN